jgi:hypothetical protein
LPLLPALDGRVCRPLLRDVIPYAASTAMGAVLLQVTMIATSLLTTETETGYFATSFRIFEVLIGIGGIVAASAFPVIARAARDDEARLRHLLQRLFELAVIGGVGIAVVSGIGAETAVRVIGGSAYGASVPVLRNVLCAVLIPAGGAGAAAVCVLAADVCLAACTVSRSSPHARSSASRPESSRARSSPRQQRPPRPFRAACRTRPRSCRPPPSTRSRWPSSAVSRRRCGTRCGCRARA